MLKQSEPMVRITPFSFRRLREAALLDHAHECVKMFVIHTAYLPSANCTDFIRHMPPVCVSCPIIAKGSYNTSTVIISGNDMKAINNIINKAINPDFIFVIDRTLAIGGDDTQNSDILNNSLLQETNAGKNGHIVTLTPDLWYLSGGGLESTKLMFEEVSKYAGQ